MAATIRVRSIWAVATVTFALVAGSLSWASEPATSPEAAFVQKTISSHKIVIFSKSYCPYSNKAKGVFKELNQVPHVIELDQRDDGQSIQDALNEIVGKRTVPQVFIDGKHLGGSDATVEAYESGELAKLLGIAISPEAAFINETIASHRIVIFSKSYCPYCKKAKGVFKELNQVPHVVELDQRDDGQAIQDAMSEIVGKRSVPQVFIDGKHIGGSDATVEAYESGELAKLLGIATSKAAFVKETIGSYKIVIFSKSYCPYCKKAKGVFKELNQVPHVVELDQRDDGQAIQDALSEIVGKRSVPQVFIDGKHIGGSDATVEAYESGELAKLLGIATSKAAFVKETISSHKIVIFSKSYCPYCKKAKGVFKELDQAPHIIELDQREDGQDIQDALSEIVGRRTVPQVFIDGKHLGGSDDTVQAYESGELAKLLGIAVKNKEEL